MGHTQVIRTIQRRRPRSIIVNAVAATKPQPDPETPPIIPFLPSEVINLIIVHYIGRYTPQINYAYWDFERPVRIESIPCVKNLALVSRAFNNIVKHQFRRAFTGRLNIDCDAATNMQDYERGNFEHLNWLFDQAHTLRIVGYPPIRARNYAVDVRHWPNLACLEVGIRITLLAHIRSVTTSEHDAEVSRIAASAALALQVKNEPGDLRLCFVFESCRCGRNCVVQKTQQGYEVPCRLEVPGEALPAG